MWRALVLAVMAAGCAQLPPSPQDIQAKRFETVPDKAVIYLVRDRLDAIRLTGVVVLDNAATIATYEGTYYRWEVAPGTHRIAGFAGDSGLITVNVEAGKLYFVQQWVWGWRSPISLFRPVSEQHGRAVVMRSELIGSR
jgi:hypothetical protein